MTFLRHPAFAVAVLAVLSGSGCSAAQPTAALDSGSEPAGHTQFTCEVYCSETKPRTANAKLSWLGPSAAARTGRINEKLQTTVYKGGFDRNLYASFQISGESQEPQAVPSLPAYDLEVLDVQRPGESSRESGTAGGDRESRTTVELEGLEPGLTYTWRVVIDTAEGQEITETIACEVPACTYDQADGKPF